MEREPKRKFIKIVMPSTTQTVGTRERILRLLQDSRIVTVSGISHALGVTRADVRYHLKLLVRDGLAEITQLTTTQPAQRGRPVLYYRLASHLAANNLPALCHALLDVYLAARPEGSPNAAILALVERMVGDPPASPSLTHRITQTVDYLNRHGYQARWEASPTGPRILFRNCPYAAILREHLELCLFDRLLIDRLGHLSFKQVARLDPVTGNPPACIFLA